MSLVLFAWEPTLGWILQVRLGGLGDITFIFACGRVKNQNVGQSACQSDATGQSYGSSENSGEPVHNVW
jgi:hypothetical protein